MISRLIYAIRYLLWLLGNLRRRLGKSPDYVTFVVEGPYPELPEPRAGFLRRRLFPRKQSLAELAVQLRAVADDPRVQGVVLHLRPLNMPLAQVQSRAIEVAKQLAKLPPLTLRATKEAVIRGLSMPIPDAIQLSFALESLLYVTDDAEEGPRAFLEKREPVFKGQ